MKMSRRAVMLAALASAGYTSRLTAQGTSAKPAEAADPGRKKAVLTPTEQLLHSTIMIRCEDAHGSKSSGTGFLFNLFNHDDKSLPVIVSNKHVVKGSTIGLLTFTRAKSDNSPDIGNHIDVRITEFEQGWIPHPDPTVDLAIYPVGALLSQLEQEGRRVFSIHLDPNLIPTEEAAQSLTPLEDLLIVGYPDGISDTVNNVPVFRRGVTATPVYLDFLGKKEFLIDSAIFPGSSGSPVFLFNQGTWIVRSGDTVAGGYRIQLLGIVYAVALHATTGEVVVVPAPTQAKQLSVSQIPNNLGLCVKSSRILEFEPLLVQRGLTPPTGYAMRAASR